MSKINVTGVSASEPGPSIESDVNKKRVYQKHATYMDDNGLPFIFRRELKSGEIVVECPNKACEGQARIRPGEDLVVTRNHSICTPDKSNIPTKALKKYSKDIVAIGGLGTRKAFEAAQDKYKDAQPLEYNSFSRTLRRHKAKKNPPHPSNLEQYVEYLKREEWADLLDYNNGKLEVAYIGGPDDFEAAIFGDPAFVTEYLLTAHDTVEIFMDGTFASVPHFPNVQQLFIIHVCRYNHVLPIAFAFMTKKTTEAYISVLNYVFTSIAPKLRLLETNVHADFEVAERNAVKKILPKTKAILCYPHFERAQIRQALLKGAMKATKIPQSFNDKQITAELEIRKCVKKTLNLVMALPLVEAHQVESLLAKIKEGITDKAVQERMEEYFHYFGDEWMRKCPPSEWSVFDAVRRTNNAAESRNRSINADFGKHPNPWKFTRSLTKLQTNITNDFQAIKAGKSRQKIRLSDHKKEGFIKNQKRLLKEEKLLPFEFLELMATTINFEYKYKMGLRDCGADVDLTGQEEKPLQDDDGQSSDSQTQGGKEPVSDDHVSDDNENHPEDPSRNLSPELQLTTGDETKLREDTDDDFVADLQKEAEPKISLEEDGKNNEESDCEQLFTKDAKRLKRETKNNDKKKTNEHDEQIGRRSSRRMTKPRYLEDYVN